MAKRREDPKVEALRAERSLNPRPQAVSDEAFAATEFLDPRDLVQVKYEMVRRVRVAGDAVSRSASAFGFSRPSFYEAAAALDAGGLPALVPARPGPRRAHKLTDEVVAFARQRREQDPSLRSADLADAIATRFGVRVHPRSVERALARPFRADGFLAGTKCGRPRDADRHQLGEHVRGRPRSVAEGVVEQLHGLFRGGQILSTAGRHDELVGVLASMALAAIGR